MTFTRDEFWWATGLLLAIVCVGSALLWVAMAVSNARRKRLRRDGDPRPRPRRPIRRASSLATPEAGP